MAETVLKTEGLTKRYGSLTAVRDLSLEVHAGEVFGFLGPNGAGKTTSINMMCGLLKADAGQVWVRGVPLWGAGDEGALQVRQRVGVCPQEIVLWERLTCLEQLQFMGQMYGLSGRRARASGQRLLDELDLAAKANKQARTLSGGMKRRLNLAMALVHDPEIAVFDEPEAGLDPQSRVKVREYIQALARSRTRTVILTTHNMDEAERLADRVAIIDRGQLLALDSPEALKSSVAGAAGGDVIEIGLDAQPETGARALAALDGVRAADGRPLAAQAHLNERCDTLTIRALNAAALLPAVLTALQAAEVVAGEVRIRRNTLEDVFIRLTGRGLRE